MNRQLSSARFPTFSGGTSALSLVFVIIALSALRLALGADRDILAVNGPYDQYWYVASALRKIWGGQYNHMSFVHLPVYSGWIALLNVFGIPGRLAIDVAWIVTTAYLAFALWRFTASWWVTLTTFVLIAFHPYSFSVFDHALAETLLAPLCTYAFGAFIELWNCRQGAGRVRKWLAWIGVTAGFALAYHTRKEGLVLLVPLLALIVWMALLRPDWRTRAGFMRFALPFIVVPLLSVVVLGTVLAGINAWRWGVFARFELAAPGYVSAIGALHAIDPGMQTPKHVTVTKRTRELAYEASPTFNELRPFFDGSSGRYLEGYTGQWTGVQGEIGNGWFYWSLRDAAASVGWHRSAMNAEAKYAAVAREIEDAFTAGRLPRRAVVTPFLDPDVGKWAREVPYAFLKALELVASPDPAQLVRESESATPAQFNRFVRALGRRSPPQYAMLAGWLTLPPGTWVSLGDQEKDFVWQPLVDGRSDVPGAFAINLTSGIGEIPTELHIRATDGTMHRIMLASLRAMEISEVPGIPGVFMGVDRIDLGTAVLPRFDVALESMARIWSFIGLMFAAAALVALVLAPIFPRRRSGPVVMVVALALLTVLTRALVLAIVDASSWNGLQARYVLPVVPAFVTFGVLGTWMLMGFRAGTDVGALQAARSSNDRR